jgi:hypothetical protein
VWALQQVPEQGVMSPAVYVLTFPVWQTVLAACTGKLPRCLSIDGSGWNTPLVLLGEGRMRGLWAKHPCSVRAGWLQATKSSCGPAPVLAVQLVWRAPLRLLPLCASLLLHCLCVQGAAVPAFGNISSKSDQLS